MYSVPVFGSSGIKYMHTPPGPDKLPIFVHFLDVPLGKRTYRSPFGLILVFKTGKRFILVAREHRGAQLHLHSPFPRFALFCEFVYVCVCVCAFAPVSPLKGLWFQRRPLYFLHCLATITKASSPLLRRLST